MPFPVLRPQISDIRQKLISWLVLFFLLTTYYLLHTTNVYAQADPLGPPPANVIHLQQLVQRLINVSVALAFIILTVVLVWAGIRFLTSAADQKTIQHAYDIITWAILGILFLAVGWLILLLIQTVTGVPVTNFCIGFNCP